MHRLFSTNSNTRVIRTCLTPKPGGAVGLGWKRVYAEALARQHVAVLRFLHQEAYLSQESVEETWQHGGAADHYQVLRQHLPSINGALDTHEQIQTLKLHSYIIYIGLS